MTFIELSLALSALTSAVAGGAAGAGAGAGLFATVIGALGGAAFGSLATSVSSGLIGVIAATFNPRADRPPRRPPSRLSEIAFLLFVAPVALAPVWSPILAYRLVCMAVGT